MAKAPIAKAEPAPSRSGAGSVILALLVLTLLSAGTGGGLGIKLASTVEQIVAEKTKAEPPASEAEKLAYSDKDTILQELKPVIANLAAPSGIFVRLEAGIIFKKGELPHPDVTAAQIREDMVVYLRTVTLSQLEGPSGLLHLREDLNERAIQRGDGKIQELVLETMVVQ
ncbi:flagellar basal body-associated FliL family protein [Ancylobacter lacus]|uniref:flagellar basal body-associated FliL family protein n=1 Tax=Ancylobacter lacus TaxID=2579970 RepID=UPI001BD16B63|nr:flagellar basal body-associated FliL family protein [Ancylobacter lacus]MBS7537938.1 flagellar basal body-associated FliL family protein [Ancylobacter lacus]